MSYTDSIDATTLQRWVIARLEPKAVEEELVTMGFDADTVAAHLKAFRRLRNAKRQRAGFFYMGLGAFLGFVSCILSVLNPIPELYNLILFGLTSVAIGIICLGMYFVFE